MKKVLLSISLSLVISLNVFSQTKKVKFINPLVKSVKIEYYVLKANEGIKEGPYQRTSRGTVSTTGEYHNNEPSGLWKVYDYNGETNIEIDYVAGTIKYPKYNGNLDKVGLIDDQIVPAGDRPVMNLLGGKELVTNYGHLLRYPADARDNNIMGKVVVAIDVDESGEIKGYRINRSVYRSIDEEAIRVVKLIDFEFLPAYKDGKPVKGEILIPISFQLAQ